MDASINTESAKIRNEVIIDPLEIANFIMKVINVFNFCLYTKFVRKIHEFIINQPKRILSFFKLSLFSQFCEKTLKMNMAYSINWCTLKNISIYSKRNDYFI